MTTTVNLKWTLKLSLNGKKLRAMEYFRRWKKFILAAQLLYSTEWGDKGYVYGHLLCQWYEIILKSYLLSRNIGENFSEFNEKMRKYWHDLDKLEKEVASHKEFISFIELWDLKKLYKNHDLRYTHGAILLTWESEVVDFELFWKFVFPIIQKIEVNLN